MHGMASMAWGRGIQSSMREGNAKDDAEQNRHDGRKRRCNISFFSEIGRLGMGKSSSFRQSPWHWHPESLLRARQTSKTDDGDFSAVTWQKSKVDSSIIFLLKD